jgi:hypothetical protein
MSYLVLDGDTFVTPSMLSMLLDFGPTLASDGMIGWMQLTLLPPLVALTSPGGVVAPTILSLTAAALTPTVPFTPTTATPDILALTLTVLSFTQLTQGSIPKMQFSRVLPRYEAVLLRVTDTVAP